MPHLSGTLLSTTMLQSSQTLKRLFQQEDLATEAAEFLDTRWEFTEYKLRSEAPPQSLRELVELFRSSPYRFDLMRIIWIEEGKSFLRIAAPSETNYSYRYLPALFRDAFLRVTMVMETSELLSLNIHALNECYFASCMDFLITLVDDYFPEVRLWRPTERQCPLSPSHFDGLLRNRQRNLVFDSMNFTPAQSAVLAQSMKQSRISFNACTFLDNGRNFVQTLEKHSTFPTDLSIRGDSPLDHSHWISFLRLFTLPNGKSLESFHLAFMDWDDETTVKEMSQARIKRIHLEHCRFTLHGAVNVGSTFLRGLSSNTVLTHLSLSGFNNESEILLILANTVQDMSCLVHLDISISQAPDGFLPFMKALAHHRTLRTLNFVLLLESLHFGLLPGWVSGEGRISRTKAVVNVLSTNRVLENIHFCDTMYEPRLWNTEVSPRLDCNRYRKHFRAFQQLEHHDRASLIGKVLGRINHNPSVTFMMLFMNKDVLAEFLSDPRLT